MAEPSADNDQFTKPPPPGFDPEYAKFLLDLEERRRPPPRRPWFEGCAVVIALLASLSGAAVSAFNAWTYWDDRNARAQKEAFDGQVTLTRIYFEKMAGVKDFCDVKDDALLYARAAMAIAGEDTRAVAGAEDSTALPAGRDGDDARAGEKPKEPAADKAANAGAGVAALAKLIYSDIAKRKRDCDAKAVGVPTAPPGTVVDAQKTPQSAQASYAVKEEAPAPAPAKGTYTVYIQYRKGSDAAAARAMALAKQLNAAEIEGVRFKSPGIEGVGAVPDRDQLRIYRAKAGDDAKKLQRALGLTDAQIVNLEPVYPNLPAGTIEVWLAD